MRTVCVASMLLFLASVSASAAWRMEVESKEVTMNQTDVSLQFMFSWDTDITLATLPIIVRQIDSGAYWTGNLPYDTVAPDLGRHTYNVTWSPDVAPWAPDREIRPLVAHGPCYDPSPYDGISPDLFELYTFGAYGLPSQPGGTIFATIRFGVTQSPGRFEFDTACVSSSLNAICMIDISRPPVNHGTFGTQEVIFRKGIVTIEGELTFTAYSPVSLIMISPNGDSVGSSFNTVGSSAFYREKIDFNGDGKPDHRISIGDPIPGDYRIGIMTEPGADPDATYSLGVMTADFHEEFMVQNQSVPPPGESDNFAYRYCMCSVFCDLNLDQRINPIDVVCAVNFVYKQFDQRQRMSGCTDNNGDWNCDGLVNPVDIVRYVNYVYKGQTEFPPCNPCACTTYPPVNPGDCPTWP